MYFDCVDKLKLRFKVFVILMFLIGLFFVFIYKELNMSICILIFGILMFMFFVWGLNFGYFVIMGVLVVLVLYYFIIKE